MDPLTHTLAGAVLADAGLGRRAPLATATLLVAANLPDVDVLSYFASADAALSFRRGWTHGVLAMAILPLVLAGAMALAEGRWSRGSHSLGESFRRLLPLAYLGMATHPLLDWLNTYGIRLLMPFTGRWFYGDTLFIIDPWLWLALGGAVFLRHSRTRRSLAAWGVLAVFTSAVFLFGSAGRPLARAVWLGGLALLALLRARTAIPTGRLARAALATSALYVALLHAATVLARDDVESRLADAGTSALDVMIGPVPIRPLAHAVIVDIGAEYRIGSYDWFSQPRLELDPRPLPKPPEQSVVAAAFDAPCLRGMVSWVRYPWVEIEDHEHGWVVHLMDARYALSRSSGFGGGSVRIRRDLSDACEAGGR